MKIFKVISIIALLVALIGCGNGNTNTDASQEDIISETSVVLIANEQQILADATMWTLTDKTKVRSRIGEKLTLEDISEGDLISYESEGPIMESYPAQGTLKKITLFNDDYSLKVSTAISLFLEDQPEGDVLEFELLSIDEDKLAAEMKLWNLESDQKFLVEIDILTNDYRLTEKRDE